MSKSFTAAEVAKHKASDDFWLIVDGDVYDLTKFQHEHPGGVKVLTRFAGKDASKPFWKYHNKGVLSRYGEKLKLGSVSPDAKL